MRYIGCQFHIHLTQRIIMMMKGRHTFLISNHSKLNKMQLKLENQDFYVHIYTSKCMDVYTLKGFLENFNF
jgi:hypothetical protein